MKIKLLLLLSSTLSFAAKAQYVETFDNPNKGYLINLVDDFGGVNWSLSSWDLQPPAEFGRDVSDYFATTAAGVLECIDLDQEVCWISPSLFVTVPGNNFSADLSWAGFDAGQSNPSEHINVEYSINSGAWVRHPNILGTDGDPAYTVKYTNGMGNNSGNASTLFQGINTQPGDTLQARICVSTNANAELATIDNVNVTGVFALVSNTNELTAQKIKFQTQPNPFESAINISWEMDEAAEVQFQIFDLQGKNIYTRKAFAAAGKQQWQWLGQNNQGALVPAGVYILTMRGDSWMVSRQVVRK